MNMEMKKEAHKAKVYGAAKEMKSIKEVLFCFLLEFILILVQNSKEQNLLMKNEMALKNSQIKVKQQNEEKNLQLKKEKLNVKLF